MKMKNKFKRCLVSLLSLSLLFLSCNCLGVNAAEGDNSDGSQNISVTDVTESSGEENTSNEQNTESTEASTEAIQGVTDEAESNISYGDDFYVTMAAPEPSNSDVCSLYRDDVFIKYYTTLDAAVADVNAYNNANTKHVIYLLKDSVQVNSQLNVMLANITIQPDPIKIPNDKKCTIKKGGNSYFFYAQDNKSELELDSIILEGFGGGGPLIYSKGNVTLNDCILQNNTNTMNSKGGAIRMECDSSRRLTLNDCTITNCTVTGDSANGGAISAENCYVEINNTTIQNNRVISKDKAGGGGAIYVQGRYNQQGTFVANLVLNHVNLLNNSVTSTAYMNDLEKIKVGGGGIYITEHAWVTLDDCMISGNTAPTGAGIFYNFGFLDVNNSQIVNNIADKVAGGVFVRNNVDAKRFSVRGEVIIDQNKATDPFIVGAAEVYTKEQSKPNWANNVLLYNDTTDTPQSISVAGSLTGSSKIGVSAVGTNNGRPDIILLKDRMEVSKQFGKAITVESLSKPEYGDATSNATSAQNYTGMNCFYRDTNSEELGYLYGGYGTQYIGSLGFPEINGANTIIWHEGSAPVNDVDFEFIKTDEQGKAFGQNEATFEIMNPDTSSGFTKVSASTDANGKVTFTGLPVNTTYRIYETKTKLHYSLPLGYWTLTVAEGGTFTVEAVSQGGFVPEFAYNETSKTYSLINHPQFQLPLTGGDGTAKIIVIGIVVLCTPILIKLKSFRKKEKSL